MHGRPWAGLGESVSSPRRTKELVWRWWWETAAHNKVSTALGPRSVRPDQFLTTGTQHINQGLREAQGPSDTTASCPPLPSTPSFAQPSCSLPRSPGTPLDVQRNLVQTSAPPSAAHQAQLLPFHRFFQESDQDFLAGLWSPSPYQWWAKSCIFFFWDPALSIAISGSNPTPAGPLLKTGFIFWEPKHQALLKASG